MGRLLGNKDIDDRLIGDVICWLVERNFPFLTCKQYKSTIWIRGTIADPDWCQSYEVVIIHNIGGHPEVFINKPTISACANIHMYKGGKLCLYFPDDLKPGYEFTLAFDAIPWTIKWLHFYEIYLRNGNHWIGPEAPHQF